VTEKQIPPDHAICEGCGREIDPTVCWCGDLIEQHNGYEGHPVVPMGCICHYDQPGQDSGEKI
jgi:predicted amidophosphoribosyltransferase